jgi:hypothetical protein
MSKPSMTRAVSLRMWLGDHSDDTPQGFDLDAANAEVQKSSSDESKSMISGCAAFGTDLAKTGHF